MDMTPNGALESNYGEVQEQKSQLRANFQASMSALDSVHGTNNHADRRATESHPGKAVSFYEGKDQQFHAKKSKNHLFFRENGKDLSR